MKRLFNLMTLLVLASLVLAACGGAAATEAPAAGYECTDALGCVKIAAGEPVHIA